MHVWNLFLSWEYLVSDRALFMGIIEKIRNFLEKYFHFNSHKNEDQLDFSPYILHITDWSSKV